MKFLSFISLFLALTLISQSSSANTVFLVQLGSFEKEAEADQFWNSLTRQYPKQIGSLTAQTSNIVLPPDGRTEIRLQAGPIDNRMEAQGVCSSLRRDEYECFVVETAMFIGNEAPAVQLAFETPGVVEQETLSKEDETETEVVAVEVAEDASSATAGAVNTSAVAAASTSPGLFGSIASAIASPFSSDEDEAENASENISEESPKAEAAVASEEPPAEPQEVAANEAEPSENKVALPWLNPVKKRVQTQFDTASLDDLPEEEGENENQIVVPENDSNRGEDAQEDTETIEIAEAEAIETPAKTSSQSRYAERDKQYRREIARRVSASAKRSPEPQPRAQSSEIVVQPLPGSQISAERLRARRSTLAKIAQAAATEEPARRQASTASNSEGSVEVAEAIPVPVSDDEDAFAGGRGQAPAGNIGLPVLKKRKALGFGGTPSQQFLEQSYWVKLAYFANEQIARNYWQKLRNEHPQLMTQLRMRLTQPYLRRRSAKNVAMQLGPLTSYDEVRRICDIAGDAKLACQVRRQQPASASQEEPSDGTTRYQTKRDVQNRYQNRNLASAENRFWAQLGSYRSRGDAMQVWDEMRDQHQSLDGMFPHLEHPAYSSSREKIYRLRTGPFATRSAAQELCLQLKQRGSACLVVTN